MRNPFARRNDGPRLSRDEADRQGRATRLAINAFPGAGAAVAFLNAHNDELGGRPLDIAVASAAGLLALEKLIVSTAQT